LGAIEAINVLRSRLLAGSVTLAKTLKGLVDNQNISFEEVAKTAGYTGSLEHLDSVSLPKGAYFGFVELHIEKGLILEEEGRP
jgi:ureidoglycolate amidohydrolase